MRLLSTTGLVVIEEESEWLQVKKHLQKKGYTWRKESGGSSWSKRLWSKDGKKCVSDSSKEEGTQRWYVDASVLPDLQDLTVDEGFGPVI